uniref:Putative longin domain-containing protein n=1 Tax=Helianthus annuus TaxID=4232 RepID=A0A251TUE8_HELAN
MVSRMKVGVGVMVGRLMEIAKFLRRTRIMLLIKNDNAYCVVAAESAGRQVPMAFLERIKDGL